jgi:hypothetical protein
MNSGSCTCTLRLSRSSQTTRHSPPTGSSINATLKDVHSTRGINPLNSELNPICHLLALLECATIVDVSRLRVKQINYIIKTLKLKCQFQISQVGPRDEFHSVVFTKEITYLFICWQVCVGISVLQCNDLFLLLWWFCCNHSWLIALILTTENQLLRKHGGQRYATQFNPFWRHCYTLHWTTSACIKLTSS